MVRQELASELGIVVSLRTVERAVSHLRRELAAEALATVRFETPPGRQLQIDFGQRRIAIDGERGKVFLFVATLGYSRRIYAAPFRHERQSSWLEGIEGAFRHFGGLPGELLLDNASALVKHHDPVTREVEFNSRLHAFTRYWDVRPVACAPYRARTKGKDERGVSATSSTTPSPGGASPRGAPWRRIWPGGCARWPTRGCTARRARRRSRGSSARSGRLYGTLLGRPPFRQLRELTRRVQTDACVDVDTNHYSVPWRLIGAEVSVEVGDNQVRIHHAGIEVACHDKRLGRRERAIDRAHLHGIVPCRPDPAHELDTGSRSPTVLAWHRSAPPLGRV